MSLYLSLRNSLFFVLLSGYASVQAQSIFTDLRSTKKRAYYYESKLAYSEAARLYSLALLKKKNKSDTAFNQKAMALYKKLAMYPLALACMEQIKSSSKKLSNYQTIEYVNLLKATQNPYADSVFSALYSKEILNNLLRDSICYTVSPLYFNTLAPEYAVTISNEKLFFVSDEKQNAILKAYNGLNNGGFSHLKYCTKTDTGWAMPKDILLEKSNVLHTGSATFFDNGKKAILNLTIQEKGNFQRLQLFSAFFDDSLATFKNIEALSLNNTSYSVGQPSITPDGGTLYFVSDMAGGYGGTDLYKATKTNDKWGNPKNMGTKVNTEGDEKYPHITPDSILFFSTDGRVGMGGQDIQYVDFSFQDTIVANMGYPVNSNQDDFGFHYDSETKTGYFSSNRKNKDSDEDIYQFTEKRLIQKLFFKDKLSKEIITCDEVYCSENQTKIQVRSIPQKDRSLLNYLKPEHKYELIIRKENYVTDTFIFSTMGRKNFFQTVSDTFQLQRKAMYLAQIKHKNTVDFTSSKIIVTNLLSNESDTILPQNNEPILKLDAKQHYLIRSQNNSETHYIYIESKPISAQATMPVYNLYLAPAEKSKWELDFSKCDLVAKSSIKNEWQKIRIYDQIDSSNQIFEIPKNNVLIFSITDPRLFDLYLNNEKIIGCKLVLKGCLSESK